MDVRVKGETRRASKGDKKKKKSGRLELEGRQGKRAQGKKFQKKGSETLNPRDHGCGFSYSGSAA